MTKLISFGPVIHKDKSYSYSQGYGAYRMGWRLTDNPHSHTDTPIKYADWRSGYNDAAVACDKVLEDFINALR